MRKEDVTVVVPIINEKEAIEKVIQELHRFGYRKILVVDGYSTDGSPEIAAKNGARVVGQVGKGKTGAIITAVNHVKTPYMLVLDGDFTYDPACIQRMFVHASGHDQIIGARTNGREYIPLVNRLGNRILNWFFKVLFAVRLSDVCSGMYLLRTKAAKAIDLTTGGFDVEVDWSRTKAWAWGGYYARVFFNIKGREPEGVIDPSEFERERSELTEKLMEIRDPNGRRMETRVYRPEDLYPVSVGDKPDLMVYFDDLYWRSAGTLGHGALYLSENDTGPDDAVHAQYGIFILRDPELQPIGQIPDVKILDIAPTLLQRMGVTVPPSMEGQPIKLDAHK